MVSPISSELVFGKARQGRARQGRSEGQDTVRRTAGQDRAGSARAGQGCRVRIGSYGMIDRDRHRAVEREKSGMM